jgi:hypothetical protein
MAGDNPEGDCRTIVCAKSIVDMEILKDSIGSLRWPDRLR